MMLIVMMDMGVGKIDIGSLITDSRYWIADVGCVIQEI
jgi:hypothetical protein